MTAAFIVMFLLFVAQTISGYALNQKSIAHTDECLEIIERLVRENADLRAVNAAGIAHDLTLRTDPDGESGRGCE